MKQNGHKYNAEMDVYVLLKKKKKELKKRKQRTEQRREEKTHEKKKPHETHGRPISQKYILGFSYANAIFFFSIKRENNDIYTGAEGK